MCECGCGEFHADFKMPGPNGTVYLLQVYPSCDNGCDMPAGVRIMKIKPEREWAGLSDIECAEEAEFFDVGGLGDKSADGGEYGADFFVSVVHVRQLQKQLGEDGDCYLDERQLRAAVEATFAEDKKMRERQRAEEKKRAAAKKRKGPAAVRKAQKQRKP